MVELRNVCGGYGDKEILHNIHISFSKGSITVIVGPNGCGKSSLLKSIIHVLPQVSGEILVDGEHVESLEATALAKRIAFLPQNKIPTDITVLRMVLHGRFPYLKYTRRYRKEDIDIAKAALEQMEIAHLAECRVGQLSGGTQQKVYIAMALAQCTSTILMDEPTVYLDISHQLKVLDIARELANCGKTIVMVLHDLLQAFQIADKMVVMQEGNVVMYGTPDEVYACGIVKEVLEIGIERIQTKNGWQYFYERVE